MIFNFINDAVAFSPGIKPLDKGTDGNVAPQRRKLWKEKRYWQLSATGTPLSKSPSVRRLQVDHTSNSAGCPGGTESAGTVSRPSRSLSPRQRGSSWPYGQAGANGRPGRQTPQG